MNLQDFLSYRDVCPLCSSPLSFAFHSKKKQQHRLINNNSLLIKFYLGSIKKNYRQYQIGYFINQMDNSFSIEFYDKKDNQLEQIPITLLRQFSEFNQNLGKYKMYRYCNVCKDYDYESNNFQIDLQNGNLGDLSVRAECFNIIKDEKIVYGLINNYETNKSILTVGRHFKSEDDYGDICSFNSEFVIETNLIKFVSKEETMKRLSKLIIFS